MIRQQIGRLIKGGPLERPARYLKAYAQSFQPGRSQSNESEILIQLTRRLDVPKNFVEFGFHWREFNCVGLIDEFSGLLIDADIEHVNFANAFLPRRIEARAHFLTLDNLDLVRGYFRDRTLGILSIDVDGNDYWLLQELISMRPAIIATEYNASFLKKRITVPYKPNFDRHVEHPSGLYHGASLAALAHLCKEHGYSLVAISDSGVNAFFVRTDLVKAPVTILSPDEAYRECLLTNMWTGTDAKQQWSVIEHLEFVEV